MYNIRFTKEAIKELNLIPKNYSDLIRKKLLTLAENPYNINNNIKRLKTKEETYRLRVGDYRVIYEIINDLLIIEIIKIKPRGNAYD